VTTIAAVLAYILTASPPEMPAGKAFTNSIGMRFVRIEAGAFTMGNGEAPPKTREDWLERDWDESPAHPVKITKPFYLGAKAPVNPASRNMPVCAFVVPDGVLGLILDAGRRSSCLAVSRDRGATWRLTKGLISGILAATAALADGALVAFGRGPDPMPMSVSRDLGKTWAVTPTPFGPIGVGNKAAVLRLRSGALLLCAPDTRKPAITGTRGTFAALSEDGGRSWPHIRHVPGVGGYLSVAQARSGVLHLFGTRMRCVAFNEPWLREGKPVPTSAPAAQPK